MEPGTKNTPIPLVSGRVVWITLLILGIIASLLALGMPTIPRNGIRKGERLGDLSSKIALSKYHFTMLIWIRKVLIFSRVMQGAHKNLIKLSTKVSPYLY